MLRSLCRLALLALALSTAGLLTSATRATAQEQIAQITCPNEIPFGQLFECGIAAVGERDEYSLALATNDKLFISVLRLSGELDPYMLLENPSGGKVCDSYTYQDQFSIECSASVAGTFKLSIADTRNNNTGTYAVYVQRYNNPGGFTELGFGPAVSGSISNRIQANTYRFAAQQNDIIRLRMLRTAGELDPYFSLYSPQGLRLADCSSYTYSDLIAVQCALNATGTYTLLLGDTGENNTGDYTLHLQRLNNPGAPTPLVFGTVVEAGIGAGAEMDVYSFDAALNDKLLVRLIAKTGDFDPQFELLNSAGTSVCNGYTYATVALDDDCAIGTAGRYTLLVDDTGNLNTGDYTLIVQRANNPGLAESLSFGQTTSGAIDGEAAIRTYTFSALQGSKINLTLTRSAGALAPWIRLYTSGGARECQAYSYSNSVVLRNCTAPADGIYTVIVADASNSAVGTYSLALSCDGGPCEQRLFLPMLRRPR